MNSEYPEHNLRVYIAKFRARKGQLRGGTQSERLGTPSSYLIFEIRLGQMRLGIQMKMKDEKISPQDENQPDEDDQMKISLQDKDQQD